MKESTVSSVGFDFTVFTLYSPSSSLVQYFCAFNFYSTTQVSYLLVIETCTHETQTKIHHHQRYEIKDMDTSPLFSQREYPTTIHFIRFVNHIEDHTSSMNLYRQLIKFLFQLPEPFSTQSPKSKQSTSRTGNFLECSKIDNSKYALKRREREKFI